MGSAIIGAIAGAALGSLMGCPLLWGAAVGGLIGLICHQSENDTKQRPDWSEPHAQSTTSRIGAGCILVAMVLLAFLAALVGVGLVGK